MWPFKKKVDQREKEATGMNEAFISGPITWVLPKLTPPSPAPQFDNCAVCGRLDKVGNMQKHETHDYFSMNGNRPPKGEYVHPACRPGTLFDRRVHRAVKTAKKAKKRK